MRTTRATAHAALVRGDDGGLHVRTFATAEAANAAAQGNPSLDHEPAETPAAKAWRHTGSPVAVSRALGGAVSPRVIRNLARAGGLPARDDGAGAVKARYVLPIKAIVASVAARGLRATVAAHRAGKLFA